jgi:O-antigen/teichoic acid export membrane protein
MFYTRLKKFNVLTTTRILESFTLNGITILFWFSGSWGLLTGFLVAQSVSILFFSIKLRKIYREYDSVVSLFEIAKENLHYPKYNIIIGIIDMMQTQNFVLLGSAWFQTAVIGLYSFAMRLLQVPLWLIIRPVANVFFSKASENMRNNEPVLPLVRKTIGSSFLLSLPFFAVLYFFGATLFALFFGEKWRDSGEIASILSLWMILDLVRTPISQIPIVLGKQKQMLFWTIFGTCISTSSIIIAGMYKPNNIQTSFSIITVGQCCYSLTIIVVTYFLSMIHDKSIRI